MPEDAANILTELADRFGAAALDDPRRLGALLNDLRGDRRRENRAILLALEERIPDALRAIEGPLDEIEERRLALTFEGNTGLDSALVAWTIRVWARALAKTPRDAPRDGGETGGRTSEIDERRLRLRAEAELRVEPSALGKKRRRPSDRKKLLELAPTGRARASDGPLLSARFSPDGARLALGSRDRRVLVYDVETLERVMELPTDDWAFDARFSPDGGALLVGGATPTIFDVETGERRATLPLANARALSVAFSPTGEVVALGCDDGDAVVWEPYANGEIKRLGGHRDSIFALEFDREGRYLASAGRDNLVVVRGLAQGGASKTFAFHSDWALAVAFSPTGDELVSGGCDDVAYAWRLADGKARELARHGNSVSAVAFSPDGGWVVSGGHDGVAILSPIDDRADPRALDDLGAAVNDVAFSPNGARLAIALDDGSAVVYETVFAPAFAERLFRRLSAERGDALKSILKKDEFETTEEYSRRVKREKARLEDEFRRTLDERTRTLAARVESAVKRSTKKVAFPVERFDEYDADRGVLYFEALGAKRGAAISPEEARRMKRRRDEARLTGFRRLAPDLEGYEIVDLALERRDEPERWRIVGEDEQAAVTSIETCETNRPRRKTSRRDPP
jgi:hypothetical protein